MHNNLIAVAISVTIGVLSAASIFIYRKILANQQYGTAISDLDIANKRIDELESELEALRLQLRQQRKKRKASNKFNSKDSSYALTDNDADVDIFSTDTDIGDDEFYDCSDGDSIVSDNDTRILVGLNDLDATLKEIDKQLDDPSDNIYHKLQILVRIHQDNIEVVWRFARACYNYAETQTDQNIRRLIILEGIEHCQRIIDKENADLYKWYAILIGLNGDYLATADKIKNGNIFNKYVKSALELSPDDYELHYLLGRFQYELANLNWFEKKIAATLFSDVPSATYEQALLSFETAEKLGNSGPHVHLYLSKCYIALKQYSQAIDSLNTILEKPALTPFGAKVHEEAKNLLKTYSKYST